jgi:hypothetical protein
MEVIITETIIERIEEGSKKHREEDRRKAAP